jgi:hypothetical protein
MPRTLLMRMGFDDALCTILILYHNEGGTDGESQD